MTDKNVQPTTATTVQTPLVGELTDSIAPLPKKGTIRRRTSLPYQLYRFARVNMGMIKMIRRSHTH